MRSSIRHTCLQLAARLGCVWLAAWASASVAQPQPPLDAGLAQLSAGQWHSCAVTAAGSAYCWGANSEGQLGDGSTTARNTPAPVFGLPAGTVVTAMAAGNGHTCALSSTGDVYCWGYNSAGQLGPNGTGGGTPVLVSDLGGPASAIAVGVNRSCAVVSGTLLCWGQNGRGQLGDGTTTNRNTPAPVTGPGGSGSLSGVTAVALGMSHSCAIASGAVYCWGDNSDGRVGVGVDDSVTPDFLTPQAIPSLAGATALGAGRYHSCALMAGGSVQCWGEGYWGQLGNGAQGTGSGQNAPVSVSGLTGATALAVGSAHSCVLAGGAPRCWGHNYAGQLGNGAHGGSDASSTPVAVTGLTGMAAIAAGDASTCALDSAGMARCWGDGSDGQLGDGFTNTDTAGGKLRDTPPWLPQTIAFAGPGPQAVGTPLTLAASASSGLPVAYAASGACSVSGNTLQFSAAGSCTVTAGQGGSATGTRPDWLPAASVQRSFAVSSTGVQPPPPQPVPSLTGAALALLGALMGLLALRRRV